MEATIRKESETKVTLILDGYFDTSVTAQTEKDVEPLYDFFDCEIVIDPLQPLYQRLAGEGDGRVYDDWIYQPVRVQIAAARPLVVIR